MKYIFPSNIPQKTQRKFFHFSSPDYEYRKVLLNILAYESYPNQKFILEHIQVELFCSHDHLQYPNNFFYVQNMIKEQNTIIFEEGYNYADPEILILLKHSLLHVHNQNGYLENCYTRITNRKKIGRISVKNYLDAFKHVKEWNEAITLMMSEESLFPKLIDMKFHSLKNLFLSSVMNKASVQQFDRLWAPNLTLLSLNNSLTSVSFLVRGWFPFLEQISLFENPLNQASYLSKLPNLKRLKGISLDYSPDNVNNNYDFKWVMKLPSSMDTVYISSDQEYMNERIISPRMEKVLEQKFMNVKVRSYYFFTR